VYRPIHLFDWPNKWLCWPCVLDSVPWISLLWPRRPGGEFFIPGFPEHFLQLFHPFSMLVVWEMEYLQIILMRNLYIFKMNWFYDCIFYDWLHGSNVHTQNWLKCLSAMLKFVLLSSYLIHHVKRYPWSSYFCISF